MPRRRCHLPPVGRRGSPEAAGAAGAAVLSWTKRSQLPAAIAAITPGAAVSALPSAPPVASVAAIPGGCATQPTGPPGSACSTGARITAARAVATLMKSGFSAARAVAAVAAVAA